jgi:hypothetical protein
MHHNIIGTALAIGGINVFMWWMMGGPMPSDIVGLVKLFKPDADDRRYHLRYHEARDRITALRTGFCKAKA